MPSGAGQYRFVRVVRVLIFPGAGVVLVLWCWSATTTGRLHGKILIRILDPGGDKLPQICGVVIEARPTAGLCLRQAPPPLLAICAVIGMISWSWIEDKRRR